MGVVYRALQLDLERVVALKVIAPELLDDDDVRARFLTEARAAASDRPSERDPGPRRRRGRRASRTSRCGSSPATTCARCVRYGGPFDPAERRRSSSRPRPRWTRSTGPGSCTATSSRRTCCVDRDSHVYLTDFGLAKAVITHSGGTRTGQWVGTLDYVSPEQIRGGRIDARADVYALGGVLHFALTGRVPFERDGDEAKLWAQLSAPPPVPSAVWAGRAGALRRRGRARDGEGAGRALSVGGRPRPRRARRRRSAASPTEPERMVARGAAAPGAAPTEPGLAAEASTRTAARFTASARAPPRSAAGRRRRLLGGGRARGRRGRAGSSRGRAAGAPRSVDRLDARARPRPSRRSRAWPRRSRTSASAPAGSRWRGRRSVGHQLPPPTLTRVDAATGQERRRQPRVGLRARSRSSADRDSVWAAVGEGTRTRRRASMPAPASSGAPDRPPGAKPRRLAVDDERRVGRHGLASANPGSGCCTTTATGGASCEPIGSVTRTTASAGCSARSGSTIWVVDSATSTSSTRMRRARRELTDWSTHPGPGRDAQLRRRLRCGRSCAATRTRSSASIPETSTRGTVERRPATRRSAIMAGGAAVRRQRATTTSVLVARPRRRSSPIEEPLGVRLQPVRAGHRRPVDVGHRARRRTRVTRDRYG